MALLILKIQFCPGPNQNLDGFNLALFCGLVEQGAAMFILPIDIFLLTLTLKQFAGEPCRAPTQQQ